ncbi:MAG: hypothetical protein L6306_00360, partial [Planctomycetales bacterium]|nr:hypothetical protein [Planctomycetales bacterium]
HETCCAADTIELAEALAGCSSLGGEFQDWARLHDDVEAMTVNAIACIQLRFTPELEKTLSNLYGQDAEKHLEIARRLDGAWAATIQNGDLVQHGNDREFINMMGCCQYAGVRALYTGWRDAMTAGDGRLYINYFMNRRSPQAAMTTETPVKGEAQIALREPAEVFVRVPGWLKPEQMTIDVGGESVNPTDHLDLGRQYVALGRPAVGTKILVRFPLEERTASEKFGGRTYAVRWRGNYVVGFSPLGMKTPIVPIFSGPFGR